MKKFLNPTVLFGVIWHQQMGHFSKKFGKKNSKMKILKKSHLWPKSLKYSIQLTKILPAIF